MNSMVRSLRWLLPGCVAGGLLASAFAQIYQVQTNVTDSQGKTVATGSIQFTATMPTTSPTTVSPAPAPVSPAPTPVAPPLPVSSTLPGMPGQTYESDRWLATFERDANGFLIAPVPPANAVYLSTPTTPGHLATDYANFSSAQAAAVGNGSFWIGIRRGGRYSNGQDPTWGNDVPGSGAIDDNIQIPGGTQQHPVVICGVGDPTLPPPVLLGVFVIGGTKYGKANVNYLEMFNLTFYADHRDPSSATYNKGDANNGQYQNFAIRCRQFDLGTTQSDHFLFSNIRSSFSAGAFDVEGNEPAPGGSPIFINDVILDHCEADHGYGSYYAVYAQEVFDLLVYDSCFAYNGWNQAVAPKVDLGGMHHDEYSQCPISPAPADMQHRYIGDIFATAGADGLKAGSGGLIDSCLFLADPLGTIAGGGEPVVVNNCVFDGDNTEFDAVEGGGKGYALGLATNNQGPRGSGIDNGGATTMLVENSLLIDKADSLNNLSALEIEGSWAYPINDNSNGVPSPKSGPTTYNNVKIHNWFCSSNDGATSDPNAVHIGSTPPMPVYTCTGCIFPGVGGLSGVSGTEPSYVNSNATISTYGASLSISGVKDGPTWLNAAIDNSSANWNPAFTAAAAIQYLQANFQVKGN